MTSTSQTKLRIAFYKAKYGNWQDKTISAVTFSEYSHCEIVFPNGECASSSSRDGGVRIKRIDLGEHWDVYELTGDFSESYIRYWFAINDGDTYDWPGAIASAFGMDASNENRKYCSYACAVVLGIDPIVTPGGLYKKLLKAGHIQKKEQNAA